MGRADIAVKNWLNDNGRFADLFNGSVFNGRKIILPDELEDLDRETDILITDKKDRRKGLQRHICSIWKESWKTENSFKI